MAIDHDVGRFQVAVNDALAMRMLNRLADYHHQACRRSQGQRVLLLNDCLERLALDVFHDEIVAVIAAAELVNVNDVGMQSSALR